MCIAIRSQFILCEYYGLTGMCITIRSQFILWQYYVRTGMCNTVLQNSYRSVTIAKLLYVTSAWISFASAADSQ